MSPFAAPPPLPMPPLWCLAVLVSSSVSLFTVLGFILQTQSVRSCHDRKRYLMVGELVISPRWVLGALLQVVPNFLGDVIAYTIAPLSLTAPLSGVSVVVNTSLAPRLLGEVWCPWPDTPATALILLGVVVTTLTGAHHDRVQLHGLAEVQALAAVPLTVAAFLALAVSLAAAETRQRLGRAKIEQESKAHFDAPSMLHVLPLAWSAAGFGCVTNICLKIFSEFLSLQAGYELILGSLLLGVIPSALYQQQALTRGYRLYPQTVFFPIYSSLLVMTNTIFGAVFFEEYLGMLDNGKYRYFLLGMSLVVAGICLFGLRQPTLRPSAKGAADGLKETLLVIDCL